MASKDRACRRRSRSALTFLNRVLLAAPFVLDGVDAVRNPEDHTARLKPLEPALVSLGLPPMLRSDQRMLSQITGAAAVLAGAGLVVKPSPRLCALTLAALNVPITVINNPIWTAQDDETRRQHITGILRGAALGTGLTVAAAFGAKRPNKQEC